MSSFARVALCVLSVCGMALTPAAVRADNYITLSVARVDDYLFPAHEFLLGLLVHLDDDTGVTGITLSTGEANFPLDQEGEEWENEEGFASFAALQTALDGVWTVTITGGSQASTSTFDLDAASWVDGDFFATATLLEPTDGAQNVSPDVTFQWTDPTGDATPEYLEVIVAPQDDDGVEQQDDSLAGTLLVTDTSWKPPLPLAEGPNELDVIYLRTDASSVTQALQVQSGSITWGDVFVPGYPSATPLVALGSDRIIGFVVPEPAAAGLAISAFAALGTLAARRRRAA